MKWNVSKTKEFEFLKKCKNISTKQENVYDAAFKAWPFSSDFNFTSRDGRFNATTCKYYCQLFVSPTITNFCKDLHLKWTEFLDPFFKTLPCKKTSTVLCEN